MFSRIALLCIVVAISAYQSQAVELIELNDANQDILLLDLSKALGGVQQAYKNEFDFNSVGEVRKFLKDCAQVSDVMSQSSDDSFQGLAKQIKVIMADEQIAVACSVRPEDITEGAFDALDTAFEPSNYEYLSAKKTDRLAEMKEKVESSNSLTLALGKLLAKRIDALAKASLVDATEHINIFFDNKIQPGLFDFNHMRYKSTCQIDLIKPVCKLVRRTSDDNISAVAADVSDFAAMLASGDQSKVAEFEKASGVTVDEMKVNCAHMGTRHQRHLRPLDQIHMWIEKGLMSHEQFEEHLSIDGELAFYNELDRLCKQSA